MSRLSFSSVLRSRTAQVHAQAEATPFLLALAEGRVTRAGVVGLLQRLVPVYAALEDVAQRWAEDPCLRPLLVPGLERSGPLQVDLALLGATPDTASPAASAYAQRIRRDCPASAPAFVAHHYTRYLGDLSGGQVVAAALRRRHGIDLAFFAFPGLRAPSVKRAYRAQLDALPWSAAEQDEAVAETRVAFGWNCALAAELEGEIG